MELPDGSKLTYQTLNSKLNGLYSIDKDGVNVLRGNYVDDKRVGNWYLFNKDKSLFARYNYDAKKLLSIDEKVLALANINIMSGDNDINSKASVCFPLISLEQYFPIITKLAQITVPVGDTYKLDKNSVYVIARIAIDGHADYFVNYEIKGSKKEYKITVDKYPFIIDWIVSTYEGKAYPSEFIIKTRLDSPSQDGNHKRFNWLNNPLNP